MQQTPPPAPAQEPLVQEKEMRPRPRPSTAEILARGVSLAEVQEAVKRLRPQIHQVG